MCQSLSVHCQPFVLVVRTSGLFDFNVDQNFKQRSSYLLTDSEISHGLVFIKNKEKYRRSSNKRLFNNLKNILYNFNGI